MQKLFIITVVFVVAFVGLACDSSKCNCNAANAGKNLLVSVGSSQEFQVGDENGCVDVDGGCDQVINVSTTS